MPQIYEYRHTVDDDEIDGLGHANNVAYVDWMQSAAVAHKPAFAGDSVVVRTWVATMKKATSLRCYKIFREADQALLATAETKWAFIDYTTGQPLRIPREVAESYYVIDE